jgi:Protein of unknown function (DUF1559)
MTAGPPDFGPPPGARKPLQFRLRELLVFVAAASGFMFLSAPLVRQYNSLVAAVLLESIGVTFFALVWWKVRTRKWAEAATLAAILFVLAALLLPAVTSQPRPHRRFECANHLKQIGIALHTYHDTYGSFPPAYVADENGKPMHSWRVLLLPFMEEQPIYNQYDFSEAWDGPNNIRLAPMISHLYGCPSDATSGLPSQTSYVVVTGRGTLWSGDKAIGLKEIEDPTASTIAVVEVHNSGIQITEPRDLDITRLPLAINPKNGKGISSGHTGGAQVVTADGSIHFLSDATSKETLLKLLLRDNGSPKTDDF